MSDGAKASTMTPAELDRYRKRWDGWPQAGPHPDHDMRRCRCAACLAQDKRWPRDGYQLTLPL